MNDYNYGVLTAYIIIGVYCAGVLVIGIIPMIWMINHPYEYLAYVTGRVFP